MDSYTFIESIKIFQNSYHTKIGHEKINLKNIDYVVDMVTIIWTWLHIKVLNFSKKKIVKIKKIIVKIKKIIKNNENKKK